MAFDNFGVQNAEKASVTKKLSVYDEEEEHVKTRSEKSHKHSFIKSIRHKSKSNHQDKSTK